MAFTDLQRVRNKTTQSSTLIDDETIREIIEDNTDDDETWHFERTVADVFDYLASAVMDYGDVRKWTRGPVSVELSSTYADKAAEWRRAAEEQGGIVTSELTRNDYEPAEQTEFVNEANPVFP